MPLALPNAVEPLRSVPIKLLATMVPTAVLPLIVMPFRPLADRRFAKGDVPPIRLLGLLSTTIPSPRFGRAIAPAGSVPMKFIRIRWLPAP